MASRKDDKERLRLERQQREQASAAGRGRRKRLGYGLGALAAVAAVVLAVVLLGGGGSAAGGGSFPDVAIPAWKTKDLQDAAAAAGCKLAENPGAEGSHTEEPVKYKNNPPDSGDHSATPAFDGATAKALAHEQIVHSFEHGRVTLWFDADTPPKARGALKAVFDEDPPAMILTRNERPMSPQVAATAWGQRLTCPVYNDRVPDALRAFRDEYRFNGPEFEPEPMTAG